MSTVAVQVANPNQIRLAVTAEMGLAEWRKILELLYLPNCPFQYYRPLNDLLWAINKAVDAVLEREMVTFNAGVVQSPDKEA